MRCYFSYSHSQHSTHSPTCLYIFFVVLVVGCFVSLCPYLSFRWWALFIFARRTCIFLFRRLRPFYFPLRNMSFVSHRWIGMNLNLSGMRLAEGWLGVVRMCNSHENFAKFFLLSFTFVPHSTSNTFLTHFSVFTVQFVFVYPFAIDLQVFYLHRSEGRKRFRFTRVKFLAAKYSIRVRRATHVSAFRKLIIFLLIQRHGGPSSNGTKRS